MSPLWTLEAIERRVMLDATGTFTGTYFNNSDLTVPVATQSDPQINFDWGKGSPASGVDPSTFSVRWTGKIKPTYSETYTFTTTADDGVRLWVNGQLLIDRWSDRPRLVGDANADGVVDFTDYQIFQRQDRTTNPQTDFNNDGVVNLADVQLLLANMGKTLSASSPVNSGTIALAAGQSYDIQLEYYQNADAANVKLEWQSASQVRQVVPAAAPDTVPDPGGGGGTVVVGNGNGLLGTYFDNINFTGTAVSRIDPTVQFRWDGFRPTSRIDTTTFSVRWEGQIQAPVTGDYTFYMKSDDGFRLWVGDLSGQPVMDQFVDQTESEEPIASYDTVHMVAGQRYNIRLEYYQNQGAAMVELGWGGPFAEQIIPTSALFPALTPTLPPTSNPPPPTQAVTQLQVSADGHFIQKSDGSQFFWLADTAWALFNGTSNADVDYYIQARADQEFTVTQAVLYNPDAFRANAFGQPIFLNNNPATPNPAYFDHVDYTLDKAQSAGMYVAVLPTWGDGVEANDSRKVFNTSNAFTYGQWLGQRYANQANIIWALGGDWNANTSEFQAVWTALANGLRAGDGGKHLITYHPAGGQTSSNFFPQNSAVLDFNTIQSGHNRDSANYNLVAGDYALSPAKPTIDSEPNYEEIPNGLNPNGVPLDDYDVRKKTYWALFAGAFGAAYGNFGVYGFTNDTDFGAKPWKDALNDPGANQMKYAKRLLLSRPYLGRVPDQSLVTTGTLSGTDHIQATRGGDGSYALIYSASGQSFTVDLTRLSGTTITATWYNPRTGQATGIADVQKSLGTKAFTPPTTGSAQDWVLVLDDKSKNYFTPGQQPPPPPPGTGPGLEGSVVGSVTDGVKTIPYRLYQPTGVPVGQRVPLILFLHGMDERGTDNVKQTTWLQGLVANTKSGQYAAYVLAPQIDPSMWFQSYNGSETQAMRLTIQAVRQVMATQNIDPTRVYVTGVSMGGMGAWDAIKWEPNLFAAAVPMSGYANPNTASIIKDIPIWAFHGSNDTMVPVSSTRNIINAIRAAGGSPLYTEVAGGGHVIWNPIYYDASHTLYAWMFAQHRATPAGLPMVTEPEVVVPVVAMPKPTPKPTPKPAPKPAPKPIFATKPVEKPKPVAKKVESLFSSAPVAVKAKTVAKTGKK